MLSVTYKTVSEEGRQECERRLDALLMVAGAYAEFGLRIGRPIDLCKCT